MRALLVYESMFGTNRTIATAIADGLGEGWDTSVVEVGTASATIGGDVDLLVVGGPNHRFDLPRPATRVAAAAAGHGAILSSGDGLREWLHRLVVTAYGQSAAVFDTRMASPRFLHTVDHGTHTIVRHLEHAGAHLVCHPEHFYVVDMQGPLVEGDADRARRWGRELASRFAAV
jgi:hypothetical protein